MTDYHGTSVNGLSLKHKDIKNWGTVAKNDPDSAQWTVVSVIPNAVARAAAKMEMNAF